MGAADGRNPSGGARALARRVAARGVRRLRHGRPRLSVVVRAAGGDPGRLRVTLDSVRDQASPAIEILVVADDATAAAARAAVGDDTRARVLRADADRAAAAGLAAAVAPHVLLAAPGDRYRPGALAELVDLLEPNTTFFLPTGGGPRGVLRPEDWPLPMADPTWGRVAVPVDRLRAVLRAEPEEGLAVLRLLRQGVSAAAWGSYLGRDTRVGPFVARLDPLPGLDARIARDLSQLDALADLPAARAERAAGMLVELAPFLGHAEVATAAQWDGLVSHAAELVEAAAHRLTAVPVPTRVAALLAAGGHRDELVRLVARESEDFATTVSGGVVRAALDVPAGLLPDGALDLGREEMPLLTQVRRLSVDGPVLTIEAAVAVRGVSSVDPEVSARTVGTVERVLAARVAADAAVTRWSGAREQDHDLGLVTLELLHEDLADGSDTPVEITWQDQGITSVTLLRGILRHGSAGRLPLPLPGDRSVQLRERAGVVVVHVGGATSLPEPTLTRVAVEGSRLRITTAAHVDEVRVVGEGRTVVAEPGAAGFWSLPLRATDPWTDRDAPLPTGTYRLELRAAGAAVPVVAATPVVDLLPALWCTPEHRVQLHRTGRDAVVLRLDPPLTDDELGRRAQRRLQVEHRALDVPLVENLVYVQSFTGQHPNDNPAAILAELRRRRSDLDVRWLVTDASSPVPEGATPVLLRSRGWYDAMTRASYLVTNIELEKWFERRSGQQVLQTFHGYPSKAMGLGLWRPRGLTPTQVEAQLDHTSRVWNTLVTPHPDVDRYYRRDYAYDGTILATGYPRNDVLVTEAAAGLRAATRARLGIRDDQRAVLYAPTWRDDLATDFRAATAVHHLDVEQAAARLGDDYVLLLRGHRFHAPGAGGSRVVDVTTYPDVNHLIAAADAAVLDYSSLRFDFALTGRPMVFLVPDLDTYGSSTRGFLWDYRETAPGPLVATTAEVVAALRDLDGLAARHGAEIADFNARYNSLHDGHAAARVVDAFFAPLL